MATPDENTSGFVSPTQVEGYQPTVVSQDQKDTNYLRDLENEMSAIEKQYGSYVGGPNAAIIKSLNQGIQDKSKQYKTNAADVENMYGELTTEAKSSAARIMSQYDQAIGQTGERASALQNVLSREMETQQARRAGLAAELGISPQNALTDYRSDDRFNEAMTQVLGQGQSWQNLLESQKMSSADQAASMRTAIGNTKNMTKLQLAEARDSAINQYKSAIAQEQSKQASLQLSPVGQIRAKVASDLYDAALRGGDKGVAEWQQKAQDKFDEFAVAVLGRKPGSVAVRYDEGSEFDTYMKAAADYRATGEFKTSGIPKSNLIKFMQIFKSEVDNVLPNISNQSNWDGLRRIGTGN